MKKYLFSLMLLFASLGSAVAQEIEITGVVKDHLGEPLGGVTISVKDRPGFGTATDKLGFYKIKASSFDFLIYSFIGFERQEVLVGEQKKINVEMLESLSNVFTDVVVTGKGAQRKITTTGAVTNVNMADLAVSSGNLSSALAGNVQGIIAYQSSGQPGNNKSEFWIRGISTFGAGASALILVDGFEREMNEISIEDIEDMAVLKDASATAIYGSRGANGVLLITTKKGMAGKIDINTKFEYSYVTRTRSPEFVDGSKYATLANEAKVTRNFQPLYNDAELGIIKNQLDPDLYPNVNWMDVMLKPSTRTLRASANLKGGGSTARYFISGSYIDEEGIYKSDESIKDYKTNANMTRWNYRTNVDVNVTKTTLLTLGVSGYLQKQNTPGVSPGTEIWNAIVGQNPLSTPVMYSNGKVPAYGTGDRTNPWVQATQTGYREYWKNVAQVNFTVDQNLTFVTKGLKFIARFGYDTQNNNTAFRIKWPEQWKAEKVRDRDGNLVLKRVSTESLMKYVATSDANRQSSLEAELHYNREFNKVHAVGGMLKGYQRSYLTVDDVGEGWIFDTNSLTNIPKRNQGISGVASYSYKFRYLAEFNFGYTGSENFKKGNRFGFFPAVSFGWNIAEESFIKNNVKWLDLLKVRYSYGKVGNDNVGTRFPYIANIGSTGNYNFADNGVGGYYSLTGLHYSKVASDQLTWEIATKHNLGFDVQVLKNKGSVTVDIFNDVRSGIFMERAYLPWEAGIQSKPSANVGKMESQGIDGNFAYTEKFGKVSVTLRGNMTYAKTEVLEREEEETSYFYKLQKGHRLNQTRGLVSMGLFKDFEDIKNSPSQTFGSYLPGDIKYKDINGDGKIDDNDVVAIGATSVPNLIYGLGLALKWKDFDFNIHFQGAGKSNYILSGPAVYTFNEGSWGNILTDIGDDNNRWISREISGTADTERADAKYPRLSYGGNANNFRSSTYWMRDGRYLRLKTLEIGYKLPLKVVTKFRMSNARVFVIGNNLAVWDRLKLWDPEMVSSSGIRYPLSKSITAGININF